mgnify:CR=1 FL=1
MDAKGEVLITIMASLAQQERQSLSQNVKLGLQFRYQNGQVQVNGETCTQRGKKLRPGDTVTFMGNTWLVSQEDV